MSIIIEFTTYLVTNRGLSEGTAREYRKDLRETQTWMVANANTERWSEVTRENIEDYVAAMTVAGLKPATIRRRVSCLRTFYQYAWQKGLQTENPAKYVSTPKKPERQPTTIPTSAITAALTDATLDATTRMMVAIAAETGIRVSELRNIKTTDINKEQHSITIIGKGNKQRTVYYGNATAAAIADINTTIERRLFTESDRNTRRRMTYAIGMHTTQQKTSPHTLRHTFATTMLNNGAPLPVIQTLLGHKSVETTERYAHVAGRQVATMYEQTKPMY